MRLTRIKGNFRDEDPFEGEIELQLNVLAGCTVEFDGNITNILQITICCMVIYYCWLHVVVFSVHTEKNPCSCEHLEDVDYAFYSTEDARTVSRNLQGYIIIN